MSNIMSTVPVMATYVGIDPGSSSGAICIIKEYKNSPDVVFIAPLKKYTDRDMLQILQSACMDTPPGKIRAVIELVHSFPGQGVASSFKFGRNYGELRMALIASDIPFEEKTPRTWQKIYGMKKDKDETKENWKKRLRQKAEQIYPNVKMNNQTADCVLISHYCRKTQSDA